MSGVTNGPAPVLVKAKGPKCKRPCDLRPKFSTKGKALPADNPALWAKVAPGARWRDCVTHGKVELPDISARHLRTGSHIAATCPKCGCYLGWLPQKRETTTHTDAELAAIFADYGRQAAAAGHRPGEAYHRFRHDFGREPLPAWSVPAKGDAS
jgi:hypothetical protein